MPYACPFGRAAMGNSGNISGHPTNAQVTVSPGELPRAYAIFQTSAPGPEQRHLTGSLKLPAKVATPPAL